MGRGAERSRAVRAADGFFFVLYLVGLPFIVAVFTYQFDNSSALTVLFVIIGLIVLFGVYAVYSVVYVFTGKFLRALSVSCGLILGALIVWKASTITDWRAGAHFRRERPAFDEMVRRERARMTSSEPIRMVVEIEDRTLIATSNSFYYVIYDETDEALRSADSVQGYWRYPKSETGVINVGGSKKIRHLSGHYYDYWTSD